MHLHLCEKPKVQQYSKMWIMKSLIVCRWDKNNKVFKVQEWACTCIKIRPIKWDMLIMLAAIFRLHSLGSKVNKMSNLYKMEGKLNLTKIKWDKWKCNSKCLQLLRDKCQWYMEIKWIKMQVSLHKLISQIFLKEDLCQIPRQWVKPWWWDNKCFKICLFSNSNRWWPNTINSVKRWQCNSWMEIIMKIQWRANTILSWVWWEWETNLINQWLSISSKWWQTSKIKLLFMITCKEVICTHNKHI